MSEEVPKNELKLSENVMEKARQKRAEGFRNKARELLNEETLSTSAKIYLENLLKNDVDQLLNSTADYMLSKISQNPNAEVEIKTNETTKENTETKDGTDSEHPRDAIISNSRPKTRSSDTVVAQSSVDRAREERKPQTSSSFSELEGRFEAKPRRPRSEASENLSAAKVDKDAQGKASTSEKNTTAEEKPKKPEPELTQELEMEEVSPEAEPAESVVQSEVLEKYEDTQVEEDVDFLNIPELIESKEGRMRIFTSVQLNYIRPIKQIALQNFPSIESFTKVYKKADRILKIAKKIRQTLDSASQQGGLSENELFKFMNKFEDLNILYDSLMVELNSKGVVDTTVKRDRREAEKVEENFLTQADYAEEVDEAQMAGRVQNASGNWKNKPKTLKKSRPQTGQKEEKFSSKEEALVKALRGDEEEFIVKEQIKPVSEVVAEVDDAILTAMYKGKVVSLYGEGEEARKLVTVRDRLKSSLALVLRNSLTEKIKLKTINEIYYQYVHSAVNDLYAIKSQQAELIKQQDKEGGEELKSKITENTKQIKDGEIEVLKAFNTALAEAVKVDYRSAYNQAVEKAKTKRKVSRRNRGPSKTEEKLEKSAGESALDLLNEALKS